MKKLLFILLSFFFTIVSHAQRFDWVTTGGASGIVNSFAGAVDIARDPQGNIYTIDFSNHAQQCQGDTLTPFTSVTTFIYKFDAQGVLQFINRVGATIGGSFTPFNIETDDAGNLYLLGQPNGVNFIIVNNDTVSAIANTTQLIKMDSLGNFVWKINTGVATNGEGCMLQYSKGSLYYQSGNLSVSKIDTAGIITNNLTASYYSSPTASTGLLFKGSGVLSNGDLLLAALSRGKVAYGTDTLVNIGNPFLSSPILLVRCDTNMNLVWARYVSNVRDPDKNFIPVTIGNDDGIYLGVQVRDSLFAGNDALRNIAGTTIGLGGVVKIDAQGNSIWAEELVTNSQSIPWSMQNATDGSGVFVGGGYVSNAQFGSITLPLATNVRPFIAKINYNGVFTQAFSYLSAATGSETQCMATNGTGDYYIGGRLSNTNVPVFICKPATANQGFYLAKFADVPDTIQKPSISIIREGNKVFFSATVNDGQFTSWNFGDGTPTTTQVNPTHIYSGAGLYPAVLTTTKGCAVRKDTTLILYSGIQKVLPEKIANNQLQMVFIRGGFRFSTATVKLIRGGTVLVADNVAVLDSGNIQANFLLNNAPLGLYDVVINATNFADTVTNGIELVAENDRPLQLQITGPPLIPIFTYQTYQIVVTNPGNINKYAVPIYIGIHPKMQINEISNFIIRDSANIAMTQAFGGDFVMGFDSTTNDSAQYGIFLLPLVAANTSEVFEFTMRSTTVGDNPLLASLGKPIFDSIELVELGLRTSCDFLADPLACLIDALGEIPIPPISCGVNALSLGCAIGNLANDAAGTRNRKGEQSKYVMDVFNLLADIAGVATCSGGPFVPKDAFNEGMLKILNNIFGAGAAALSGNTPNIPTDFLGLGFNIPGSCTDLLRKPLKDIVAGDLIIKSVQSLDPNDKTGPVGFTPENYFNGENVMHYRIRFENVDTATASARQVIITDTLDASFYDISSLRFTGFGFADSSYQIINGKGTYAQEMDLRPAKNGILRFEATVDTLSNSILWKFYTLNPATRELVNTVTDGFLNPNVTSPEGEGFVTYSIAPKSNRPHLQQVSNKAYIVFDQNDAIITNAWINTVDKLKPSSNVNPLPAIITDTVFVVSWTGTDAHSGVLDYNLFVTINDTLTYQLLYETRFDSVRLYGKIGDTYKFWTTSRDRVGNIEDAPAQPDAIVTLQEPVGIKHLSDNSTISVTPNPATNTLTVTLSEMASENSTITITGVNGAVELSEVMQGGLNEKQINISMLPAGVHFITIRNGNMNITKMFVKD